MMTSCASGSSSAEQGALVRVRARFEQRANVGQALVVERVRKGVGALGHGAVPEEQSQALRVLRLGRVIAGLAVVRIRARLHEHGRMRAL
jgi:hypothetical protein